MVEEVNKIIYNMLISGRGVYLPDVGTLFIERQGARKISSDKLLSPRNVVSFSSQEQAPSLVTEIQSVASCGEEQARDIYERWLAKTRENATVTIGGVGVLNNKSFATEAAFNTAINPRGVKTLVMRRSSSMWLYILSGVCIIIALGVCAYLLLGDSVIKKSAVVNEPSATEQIVAADSLGVVAEDGAAEAVAAGEVPATTTDTQKADQQPVQQPAQQSVTQPAVQSSSAQTAASQSAAAQSVAPQSYAYYVVMGVFSTEQNAERAVEQAQRRIKDLQTSIMPFKGKYMVTLFGSAKRDDCNAFATSYRDIYPDLWIYQNK